MKRTFTIEWPNDSGPMWMNADNLMLCITAYCGETVANNIFVTDITVPELQKENK